MTRKRGRKRGGGGSGSGSGAPGGAQTVTPGSSGGAVETTDPIEDLFLSFFEQYREGNDNVMFYKAELAAMELRHSPTPTLRIDYLHVMEHSPQLGFCLLSDTERTKGLIAGAFKRYIPKENYMQSLEISVYCYNFPIFDRKEVLLEFLTSSPPVVAFRLHDGVETPVCSPSGSKLFQGFVDYLLTHHKKGLTWNGDFQAVDMMVLTTNGRYEFLIMKKPSPGANHDSVGKDFKRLADVLLHHYTLSTTGQHSDPPYFTQLCKILRNIPQDVPSNVQSMERFTMFLCNHMAFLPSLSRSNLIYNLMRVYKVLSPSDKQKFEQVVDQGGGIAFSRTDWRSRIYQNGVYGEVYNGRPVPASKQKQRQNNKLYGSYTATGNWNGPTQDTKGNPTISTLEEVDYLLSYLYDKFLVDILKRLVDAFNMKSLLEQVWMDCTSSLAKNCSL